MSTKSSRSRRPTLLDVAAAAGVSRATASLVLRDAGNLTDTTRERVRAAMLELGYVYHRAAASLRIGASRTVGLIVPASSNLFMSEFTSAFELDLLERDLITLVCHSYEDVDRQARLIRSLLERGVDGLAVVPAVGSARSLGLLLDTIDIPVVFASRPLRGISADFVGPDNTFGGRIALRHLLEHDISSVAYVGGPAGLEVRDDRITGIRQEIADRQATLRLVGDVPSALSGGGGRTAIRELDARGPLPDALICHSETIAFGAYRVLRDEFSHLVETMSIIAFDDVEEAALWEPPLTTVAANARTVGTSAARLLADSEPDRPRRSELIEPHLVIRRSCGCPASR